MDKNNKSALGIILIGALFFIFGFITWSNAQLIPYLKIACQLSDTQSYLVATAFFAAYFFTSYPSSLLLKKIGFKKGMSIGLLIMAVGAILFVPAALMVNYYIFLLGLFIIGTGLAMLQTAANPYVTILGPIESAAKRMSIMGICNKLAGIISVYALGKIVLNNADEINKQIQIATGESKQLLIESIAQKVIIPYLIITLVLVILAVVLNKIMPDAQNDSEEAINQTSPYDYQSIFQIKHLILGALAIFFYVGVEVLSYDTFSAYGQVLGYSLDEAKNFATYTGYALLVGYVVGIIAIPKFITQRKALIASSILSILLILLAIYLPQFFIFPDNPSIRIGHEIPVVCFALLGFSNAAIWPAIWPLAIDNIGKHTEKGSALLVMGIVGGAVLPPLYGVLTEVFHDKLTAYWIMIPCYLYLLYYAIWGSKQNINNVRNNK